MRVRLTRRANRVLDAAVLAVRPQLCWERRGISATESASTVPLDRLCRAMPPHLRLCARSKPDLPASHGPWTQILRSSRATRQRPGRPRRIAEGVDLVMDALCVPILSAAIACAPRPLDLGPTSGPQHASRLVKEVVRKSSGVSEMAIADCTRSMCTSHADSPCRARLRRLHPCRAPRLPRFGRTLVIQTSHANQSYIPGCWGCSCLASSSPN